MSVERWEIAISQTLLIRSKENLRTKLRPTITLRQWSNLSEIKSNMAAAAILKNGYDILILPVGGSSLTKFCIPMQIDMSIACVRFERSNKLRSVRNAPWRIRRCTSAREERTDRLLYA